MSKINYAPLEVYQNLPHLLRHRNLELVSGSYVTERSARVRRKKEPELVLPEIFDDATATPTLLDEEPEQESEIEPPSEHVKRVGTWLPDKEFVDHIQWERYIIIESRDLSIKDRRYPKSHNYCKTIKTKTFIVVSDKDHDLVSADIAKILGKLPEIKSSTRKFNMDIIIISENYLSVYAAKKLASYSFVGSETAGYVNLINELFTLFNYDIFTRESASKHRILTLQEEDTIIKSLNISKQAIQKISPSDAICIVLGAVPGDVIEIISHNDNTIHDLHYRIVRL
jgi:DNA-directed RNA polymerase subunit H (RpoH/RPB5)